MMFDEIQTEVATRLRQHPYLADIDVITEDKGDIDTQIERMLANLGLSITVLTVAADSDSPDAEPLYFDEISVIVEVCEFVMMNRGGDGTGKPVGKVCEAVMQALHLYQSEREDTNRTYSIAKQAMISVTPPEPATAARHVAFITSGELPVMRQTPVS